MRKALPLPRSPRLEGDPVDGAFQAMREARESSIFILKVDRQRGARAAHAANRSRNNQRFANQLLKRLTDATTRKP